nr:hypothetical protein [Tanacetum cinerariifolium]
GLEKNYGLEEEDEMVAVLIEEVMSSGGLCDDNKDLDFCPLCNTSRWKDSNTTGKKVPKKVLRYFPIIPRLQCLYKSSHTAKEMIWHAIGKCTEPGKMQHPVDGRAWKNFDTKYPNFAKEPRNVRLGLAADGFNSFGNFSQAYSMWPVILTTYNLPPWLALEVGPIRLWWMYPFERYIKKLKGYVRNKAKLDGSIAKVYVAEEALTFSSHYFRDVTTKFNHPDRNFDAQELKKVKRYVLHNSPEIYTYRSQFKSLFPNKDMKEEFPDWFGSQIHQCHVDNDKDLEVSTTSELFALACGPTWTSISINSCVVDGLRYVVHSHDERRITQKSSSPAPDEEMYYGRKVKRLVLRNNMTQIDTRAKSFKDDQYILVTQVKQVFYLEDKAKPYWRVVEHLNHKKFSDGGVIVVEDDPDIIHFDNSSDLLLSTSLNDLDNATLHIDGQSTEVDVPPNIIIDVVDEDDDILRPHMQSPDWTEINAGIQRHLQKAYNTNKAAFKAQHWVIDPMTETYNMEKTRRERPENITASEWDTYIEFWNDPRNIARAAQNRQNRAKSTTSTTQEYPSLIDTFFVAHTVNEEFLRDKDRRIYEEMRRLEVMGTYTDDEINHLARGGKQRRHIAGVGRVLPAWATASPSTPAHDSTLNSLHKKVDFMMSIFKSDSKYSDMFSQFESGGASGSGGCMDEEEGADHQDDEDEDGDGDT